MYLKTIKHGLAGGRVRQGQGKTGSRERKRGEKIGRELGILGKRGRTQALNRTSGLTNTDVVEHGRCELDEAEDIVTCGGVT